MAMEMDKGGVNEGRSQREEVHNPTKESTIDKNVEPGRLSQESHNVVVKEVQENLFNLGYGYWPKNSNTEELLVVVKK